MDIERFREYIASTGACGDLSLDDLASWPLQIAKLNGEADQTDEALVDCLISILTVLAARQAPWQQLFIRKCLANLRKDQQ